jgi:hypothetical protein
VFALLSLRIALLLLFALFKLALLVNLSLMALSQSLFCFLLLRCQGFAVNAMLFSQIDVRRCLALRCLLLSQVCFLACVVGF